MATTVSALAAAPTPPIAFATPSPTDRSIWIGLLAVAGAAVAGLASTGIDLRYFLQPTGVLIVLGGTLGVTLTGTPWRALKETLKRVRELATPNSVDRPSLLKELAEINRARRTRGLWSIDRMAASASNALVAELLLSTAEAPSRTDMEATFETRLRIRQRQSDNAARVLEIAGGFAPTLGVLGTVIGLIDVLRQFGASNEVYGGIGTAFVSTIYGLALANLCLLPLAYRIRAYNAEVLECQEMIFEAVLCIYEGVHPWQFEERLKPYTHGGSSE